MSKKNFNDITEAQEYLEKLQAKVAEYNDLQYNLGQEMEKEKTSIMALKNLQSELRKSNYDLWVNQAEIDKQVQDVEEETVVTINDIVGGIFNE